MYFLFSAVYIIVASTGVSDWTNGMKGTGLVYACSVCYLNIIVNPLIYAARIQRIRRYVCKILNISEGVAYITDYKLKDNENIDMDNSCW